MICDNSLVNFLYIRMFLSVTSDKMNMKNIFSQISEHLGKNICSRCFHVPCWVRRLNIAVLISVTKPICISQWRHQTLENFNVGDETKPHQIDYFFVDLPQKIFSIFLSKLNYSVMKNLHLCMATILQWLALLLVCCMFFIFKLKSLKFSCNWITVMPKCFISK